VPALLDDHGRNRFAGDGFTLHACFLHPLSRGRIALAGADPRRPPRIAPNYLGDAQGFDLRMMVQCARMSAQILRQPAFERFRGAPIFPAREGLDDAGLADLVRRKAESIYHPVGSCRMGNDAGCVADPQLRVHGIDALRVVDASVMPALPSGNTNAPTLMPAERAADLILGRERPETEPGSHPVIQETASGST